MNIFRRAAAPTPGFFKKLRLLGFILSTVSGILLDLDSSSEAHSVAGHLATVGAVLMAVSQLTVEDKKLMSLNDSQNMKRGT